MELKMRKYPGYYSYCCRDLDNCLELVKIHDDGRLPDKFDPPRMARLTEKAESIMSDTKLYFGCYPGTARDIIEKSIKNHFDYVDNGDEEPTYKVFLQRDGRINTFDYKIIPISKIRELGFSIKDGERR